MRVRAWLVFFGAAALLSVWLAFQMTPETLPVSPARPLGPVVDFTESAVTVRVPERRLVADVATSDDEFFAYLMFGYLRGLASRDECGAWLTYERHGQNIVYVIRLAPQGDLLTALPYVAGLRVAAGLGEFSFRWVPRETISRYEAQTGIFDRAYNVPTRRKLERLPRTELTAYMRRFIRFKALTDGRVRRQLEAGPRPPNRPQAHKLAEDIVTIADFYSLPLDFFLGIGAMENNYMHTKGDLRNTLWKKRAAKGDVILKRGPKGVLVLNESTGIWQITRETLRYAHRLYLSDTRDYSKLPEHLRPPRELDINDVPPEVLTTYAGLFFRDLMNRFSGDVATAVGAYNGGPGNPNPKYEAGVRLIADYARRVMEHAAALNGSPATAIRYIGAGR